MKFHLQLIVVLLFSNVTLAQFSEGYFEYSIDVLAADTTLESQQKAGLLQNSSMRIYFSDGYSRVDFKMGEIFESKTILDYNLNRTLMVFESINGKFATLTNIDTTTNIKTTFLLNLQSQKQKKKELFLDINVEK